MNNQNFFESNSNAADQETSYQELSYPVENEAFSGAPFQGSDHQPMKNVFQMNQSLPSPPPTPVGLKNIADVLDSQKNMYSSQMNSNFLNYHHQMNSSLPSFPGIHRYGYDSDHMTAAAAVAAAQSQQFYPQEPSINSMSMDSLISPDLGPMRNYQDMMRGVPLISNGKLISEGMSDGKVYKCMKPNCSKVGVYFRLFENFPLKIFTFTRLNLTVRCTRIPMDLNIIWKKDLVNWSMILDRKILFLLLKLDQLNWLIVLIFARLLGVAKSIKI